MTVSYSTVERNRYRFAPDLSYQAEKEKRTLRHQPWAYLFYCADGYVYVGKSAWLARRWWEHLNGRTALRVRQHGGLASGTTVFECAIPCLTDADALAVEAALTRTPQDDVVFMAYAFGALPWPEVLRTDAALFRKPRRAWRRFVL